MGDKPTDCAEAQKNNPNEGWGFGQCPPLDSSPCLPSVPIYDMGKEKKSSKVKWECNGTGKGSVCKAVCGPSAVPSEDSEMKCVCKLKKMPNGQKQNMCSWAGRIKDHCKRLMCPPLAPVQNGDYIATDKKLSRKIQRMSQEPLTLITARWGKQYKCCPTGVPIPKTKVKCTLQCDRGFTLKAGSVIKKAVATKASCKCKTFQKNGVWDFSCKWDHKARECVKGGAPQIAPADSPKKSKKNKKNKKQKN